MSEPAVVGPDDTMKFGLLMESAQAHQKLAEVHLEKLKEHTQDIDGIVREEIRRTLLGELRALTSETQRATHALRGMQRGAHAHNLFWNCAMAALCTAIPLGAARWVLPSQAEIAVLRTQRDALSAGVARLERQGARAEWRSCGETAKPCVRVDRHAAVYGDNADFYVIKER